MKKIAIVMPVANEEDTIKKTIDTIVSMSYENLCLYIIMDSYSKDKTFEIAKSLESERVRVVFYKESCGVASCYLKGFKEALNDQADYIVEMDAGGSHDPKLLPQFIQKLEEGYDCVWGSRLVKGGKFVNVPLYRQLISRGGTILSNFILNTKLKDMTSGYEAFNANVLKKLDLDCFLSKGHMYQTEMRYYCHKYRSVEIPISYIGGKSSFRFKSILQALKTLFMLRRNMKNIMK